MRLNVPENSKDDKALDMAIEALKVSEIPTGSDLISRQDAIDAIRNRVEKSEVGKSVDHDKVIADIESLPSAWIGDVVYRVDVLEHLLSLRLQPHENDKTNPYIIGWNDLVDTAMRDFLDMKGWINE